MSNSDKLDAIIDDVARGMTTVRGVDMRATVLARLGTQRASRPWLLPAGALAAVACTALIAAYSTFGTRHSRLDWTEIASITRSPGPLGPGSGGPEGPPLRTSAKPQPRVPSAETRMPAVPSRVPSADQLAWQAASVAPLAAVAPLTLEDIQPEPLDVRPLTMTPLDVPLIGGDEEDE